MVGKASQSVGRYRLLNLLRSGKSCQVWEAINDASGQRLALKVLFAELVHDRAEIGYLKHEFEVGQKLKHPHVIEMYEYGRSGDDVYLAMELCIGANLKQLLFQGFDELAPHLGFIIEQAAEGLSYFHTQGWVHRDIKPDNFLMNPAGEVKLIDFALAVRPRRGLAKLLAGRSAVQGTRSYMSPEQIRGQALDQRADIYSFGCVLFELVTGKLPFTGASTNELLNKHLHSPPPPLESHNRNVQPAFGQLVLRMLGKNPAQRPATMQAFLEELRRLQVLKALPPVKTASPP